MQKYVIGIDEAGRGPLAGPVSVGVAMVSTDFDWELLPGVNDSKQLSEKRREEIFAATERLAASGHLAYAVSLVAASIIDKQGIVPAVRLAMKRSLYKLDAFARAAEVEVKLDGGLRAPEVFLDQETIIKGDAKERVIGLASIMAKVTRDRYMVRQAAKSQFKAYDFATHKGYGTKTHRATIAAQGPSSEHRLTFCKNIVSL